MGIHFGPGLGSTDHLPPPCCYRLYPQIRMLVQKMLEGHGTESLLMIDLPNHGKQTARNAIQLTYDKVVYLETLESQPGREVQRHRRA